MVQALPTYAMILFLFPRKLCKSMVSLIANFLWGHMNKGGGIHWRAWKRLGKAKAQGGLGFRGFEGFNKALLAKRMWRLLQQPDSLARQTLKAKYFPSTSLLDANLGHQPSLLRCSLKASFVLVKEGMFQRVGNGNNTYIWSNNWIPVPITLWIQSIPKSLSPNAKVQDLIDPDTKSWKRELIYKEFSTKEANTICFIPITSFGAADKLCWWPSKDGLFSVKSTYHLEMDRTSTVKVNSLLKRNKTHFRKPFEI